MCAGGKIQRQNYCECVTVVFGLYSDASYYQQILFGQGADLEGRNFMGEE